MTYTPARMVRRALRAALFAALVLVLWTLARPARAASAPFCDDRGATALAAPPALEASGEAIRRAHISSCTHEKVELGLTVRAQRRAAAPPSEGSDKGWQPEVRLIGPALGEVPKAAPVPASPSLGVRARVERPPRI